MPREKKLPLGHLIPFTRGRRILNSFRFNQICTSSARCKNAAVQLTQQATTEKAGSYQLGLGWFVREQDNGTKIIWHGGNTAGHSAILMIDLNKKKAVTILANVAAVHPEMGNIEKLAAQLLQE